MSTPELIQQLVAQFARNRSQYESGSYNEAETRVEFINPFWKELGWDMDNLAGYALPYRDVLHEAALRVQNRSKNRGKSSSSNIVSNNKVPDYAFRLGGQRKFFLEAKKPAVAIKTDIDSAYQLRCYGWTCGLHLSVLTNFAEFAVYDCRIRPVETDAASVARIKYITCDQYVERWDEIAEVFHRENILRGSFDRFVASRKSRSGTSEVDNEFLKEIETWREWLAKDITKNNPKITVHELNFAVQRTIDRILFLRMAEDRGIEPEDQLLELCQRPKVHKNLQSIYGGADDKYNSGFFHFTSEKDRAELPDTLTPSLTLSDKPLVDMITRLYSPKSPYRFDLFPVEILGNVYERFLGKVIRLTPARQVKIEEKPEVRKAGGVYYTPSYIVDHIVQSTVGVLCAGKTPQEVSLLKVLDPSCGSGSFLLGAYKFLLHWHLDWYLAEHAKTGKVPQSPVSQLSPAKRRRKTDPNALFQSPSGDWKLTLAERKRILLNNIFGVDIDAQAVEVTKLSLSFLVLENASSDLIESNLRLFHDRALPDLGANILCGNAIIGSDYWHDRLIDDPDERFRINAFDWHDKKHGFGDIMKEGGFHAVIGNPPYVRHELLSSECLDYYQAKYQVYNRMGDLFSYFYEQGFQLLRKDGILAIISNTFNKTTSGKSLRNYLACHKRIVSYLDLTDVRVFAGTTTYPIVIVLRHDHDTTNRFEYIKVPPESSDVGLSIASATPVSIPQKTLEGATWSFQSDGERRLIEKLQRGETIKSLYGKCYRGIVTGYNAAFLISDETKRQLMAEDPRSADLIVPLYEGSDIKKWASPRLKKSLIATYPVHHYNIDQYPAIKAHLLTFGKTRLNQRGGAGSRKLTKHKWFETQDSTSYWAEMKKPKIIWPNLQQTNRFCFDESGTTVCAPSGLLPTSDLALLGILNSKVVWKFLTYICVVRRGGYLEVKPQYFEQIPIPHLSAKDRQKLESRVHQLLEIHRELQKKSLKDQRQRTALERQVASLERAIDETVYELYGLTDEEVRLVEA